MVHQFLEGENEDGICKPVEKIKRKGGKHEVTGPYLIQELPFGKDEASGVFDFITGGQGL